ncbi:PadR family transcriptional regulator [uncultured Methanobrevibacter sp.]|uniref:PadR family transcriptional regulator n=1 Tax=uncultured Methanobrevibacter sp. TaxID=253161 RepID=UPI0025DA5F3A|nr:PadR family transcriptional regulator [uncultured Methanobrevibacter sp.]
MTDENFDESQTKLIKHFSNGLTRNLILWIISKEKIHGYGIMKKLDEFFDFDDLDCDIKNTSSKVYPILRKMESNGLIVGEWDINENNKRVKYYTITEEGLLILDHIGRVMKSIADNPSWLMFYKDIAGVEISYEKRN